MTPDPVVPPKRQARATTKKQSVAVFAMAWPLMLTRLCFRPVKVKVEADLIDDEAMKEGEEEDYQGVIKLRLGQNSRIGVLWEGRMKSLLYSIGSGIDLQRPDQPFRTLGLEIQYSS